jgi:hypothetical protein
MANRLNLVRASLVTLVNATALAAVVAPATAHAADNKNIVDMQPTSYFTPNNKRISFRTIRYVYNPDDPVDLTVTEAADGLSVTITAISTAAGGFTASAPCSKTSTYVAVCPTSYAPSFVVTDIYTSGTLGADTVTVTAPSLKVSVSLGAGDDVGSIPESVTGSISGGPGDDTLTGGTGTDYITADAGTDTIYVYDSPAAVDHVSCGLAAVESPADTVIVDSSDVIQNTNCLSVNPGP